MRWRDAAAIMIVAVGLALAASTGRALAQPPPPTATRGEAPSPFFMVEPEPTAPKPKPPTRPANRPKGWNLSDVVDGLIAMESAGLPLRYAQIRRIRPALQRVLDTLVRMNALEARLTQLLTPAQRAFVQKEGKTVLPDDPLSTTAAAANRDPVVARALRILEQRAR